MSFEIFNHFYEFHFQHLLKGTPLKKETKIRIVTDGAFEAKVRL